MNITLDAFLRRVARDVEKEFNKTGKVLQQWVAQDAEGKITHFGAIWNPALSDEEASKHMHALSNDVRDKLAELGAVRYAHVAEAWCVANDGGPRPRIHPNRCEIVIVEANDGDRSLTMRYDIIRPVRGKPYLDKPEMLPGLSSGRLADMLRPAVRLSDELKDDEGTIFVTAAPGAPFQVLGRRHNGKLYVAGRFGEEEKHKRGLAEGIKELAQSCSKETGVAVEVVTGLEAEELIAAFSAYEKRHAPQRRSVH
jgi:hypothetical protein